MTSTLALIDIGGSSVKVTIRDNSAEKTESAEIALVASTEGKHIYLHPNSLFELIIEAMNKCAKKFEHSVNVEKVFISSLRQGFCLIDGTKEVTPIYLNNDTSGDFAKADIEKYGSEKIYDETGHWFAPQLTLPKLINLMRNQPSFKSHSIRLLFVHDWLAWKFTNQCVTEMTLVSAGQMALIPEKRVHTELLENFGISPDILASIEKFGFDLGCLNSKTLDSLSSNWKETHLYVGGGDSHFLHLGASGNQTGRIVVSAGSSTPISLLTKSLGKSKTLHPWKSTSFDESMYLLEGNLGYPGSFFGWLERNGTTPLIIKAINVATISKAPTVFGACNMWNEKKWESRPTFSILGDYTNSTSYDLALGLTLDYAFALANQISQLVSDKYEVNEVILTGGGGSTELQRLLRALIEIPVYLISPEQTVDNIFSILEKKIVRDIDLGNEPEYLDEETSHYLREHAKKHALLYEQVEGTRKVLQNVK